MKETTKNIMEAVKNNKGEPFEIQGASRDDLPDYFKEMGFKVGVEVGVSLGYNLELYCKEGLQMYGVDPWSDYDDEKYRTLNVLRKKKIKAESFEDIYKLAAERLAPYPNCTLIKKSSMDALEDIPKRSLDFVYIDGNHKYGYVAMDLMKWSDKVRKGGVIAGHDYYDINHSRQVRQVGPAVDGFVKSHDISNWYLLGQKFARKKYCRDRCMSFMIFKHW